MRACRAVATLVVFASLPATASSLTTVATVGGSPAIGAVHGTLLYGTDPYGGANGSGALFQVGVAGASYRLLHSFVSGTDGATPNAKLTWQTGGVVSGTTQGGGAAGGGTIFRHDVSTGFSVMHPFGASGDGSGPLQGTTGGAGGMLYGSTSGGAVATNGNVWSLAPDGTYTMLHDFLSGSDGHCPFSGVTIDAAGNLYGTTVGRGFGGNPNGSVWKLTPSGTLTTLYVFGDLHGGEWPDQAPVADQKGDLHGTTHVRGGQNFAGALWKISAAGHFSVLHDFVAATDGSGPNGPLIQDRDGSYYGTTSSGGQYGYGTLYRVSPAGKFAVAYSFTGGADGGYPTGGLVHDFSGAIYGGTYAGTVFKFVP